MKITPLEIRQKTFEKAFRGLDKDEVHAFLLTLSQQWERMNDENKDLKMKLEVANRDVQKMREVESSLYKTLKTAEDTGNSMMEQASKSAELQLREAQLKADQLLNDARRQARGLIDDAYKQSEKTIAEMQREVKALEQDYQRMEGYLDTLVRDLKNLASDALDKVEKTKAKPKTAISDIMSRAANVNVKQVEMHPELKNIAQAEEKPISEMPKPATGLLTDQPVKLQQQGGGSEEAIPPSPVENPRPSVTPSESPFTPGREMEDPTRTPDVTEPKPETPNPLTPVPDIPGPEVEKPKKDIPEIPKPEIEQPKPEIEREEIKPEKPEVQPPMTKPESTTRPALEKAPAGGGSFFDEI